MSAHRPNCPQKPPGSFEKISSMESGFFFGLKSIKLVVFKSWLFGIMALGVTGADAEIVSLQLSKVADLPVSGSSGGVTSPQNPRGGILQIGNDLWFTTYGGGENSVGAVVSYNLGNGAFTTRHSFGLPDPSNPLSARYDGFWPWKTTLTLGADGLVYFAAQFGGVSWTGGTNGGALGSFDPATVQSAGVKVLWSGSTAGGVGNLGYAIPIYIPGAGGAASIFFNTYAGGSKNWGTVQKLALDATGNPTGVTTVVDLNGPNGKQSQGGLLLKGDKLYYAASGTNATASSTLVEVNTTTNVTTVLSNTWFTAYNTANGSKTTGGWSTPIYDATRNAIYSLGLSGGILKWDFTTGTQSLLPNSGDGGATNFADPVLFGNSIYYVKQGSGTVGSTSWGTIWRYDLESQQVSSLYNLYDFGARSTNQSGKLNVVVENGKEVLYFLTDRGGANDFGSLFRLEIAKLEPPGKITLALDGSNINVSFKTVAGETYTVEKSTTLAPGSWTVIATGIAGTGAVQTIADVGAGALPRNFYRVRYSFTAVP